MKKIRYAKDFLELEGYLEFTWETTKKSRENDAKRSCL